jgi:hypothetical protein
MMLGTKQPKSRTPAMTDAELVEAARRGDAASLGLLLERYRAEGCRTMGIVQ